MELTVKLEDLMDSIDSESEFEDYGYFLDPNTGVTHLLWDMQADGSDDPALFEELSSQIDGFIKLPDRSMTDLYERARSFIPLVGADAKMQEQLEKALKKAERKKDISIFLGEANALGLYEEQLAYWNERDEAFVRSWCAERGIAIA